MMMTFFRCILLQTRSCDEAFECRRRCRKVASVVTCSHHHVDTNAHVVHGRNAELYHVQSQLLQRTRWSVAVLIMLIIVVICTLCLKKA